MSKFHRKVTWLNPLIVGNINNSLLSNILAILEPVSFDDSTSMRGVTAVAALLLFREDNVSFIVDDQMLALCGDIG